MEDTHIGIGDLEAFLGQAEQEPQMRSFFGVSCPTPAIPLDLGSQPACSAVLCRLWLCSHSPGIFCISGSSLGVPYVNYGASNLGSGMLSAAGLLWLVLV